jgi:uncharacterized membrane protein
MSERNGRSSWLADTLGNRPFVVALLYLICFFLPIMIIVAVPLAFIFRREPSEEWEQTHYRYLTRTFWLVFGLFAVLTVLFVSALTLFGDSHEFAFPVLALLAPIGLVALGQFGVRSVLSMGRAVAKEPMPRPDTLLF